VAGRRASAPEGGRPGPVPAVREAKCLKWAPGASDISGVIRETRTVPERGGSSPVDPGVTGPW